MRPGGVLLGHMLETVGEDGLGMIGSLSAQEAAESTLRAMDAIFVSRTGARVQPLALRLLAEQAEEMASIYRSIADDRERESS